VHDRGPGIPTESIGTIWRKFGRLDHAVPGSGLGLYLARGVARAHGGDLRYRAGDPVGSVFVLELPDGADGH
jgi:signal transduction histidine kinase